MQYLIAFLIAVAANLLIMGLQRVRWNLPPLELGGAPRRLHLAILIQLILHGLFNISIFVVVAMANLSIWWLIAIPVSSLVVIVLTWKQLNEVIFFLWRKLNKFVSVGITDADTEVRTGTDYKGALVLCTNELKFLGIGASKLTREPEFENALARCRPDRPIKFLLLNPTDERLVRAAQRFERDRDEYKRIVIDSLGIIAQLRDRRALNIEVRFYSTEPIFRLMFIDDSICLFSYYVLGEGDGSQLPQLHVESAPQAAPSSISFYHALELYFEKLWADSQQWDFKDYLQ